MISPYTVYTWPVRGRRRALHMPSLERLAVTHVRSTLIALALATTGLSAQDSLARIEKETARVTPAIIEIRHQIHQNPELSNREEKTAALVADYLRKLGLEVRTGVAKHGVVALLKGGRPGPVVAVRADIDALPVTEETSLPFASKVRATYLGQEVGVMHACGHDIHTAVQLGVANVLAAMKADLPGTVKFIFQPAEEGPPPGEEGGASLMVKEGALENPRPAAIFGLHAFSEMAVGEIGYSEGPAFSAADTWEVKIVGKQSHGARPELSVDPIVTAAQFIQALQTIRSRTMSGNEPGVVTVGTDPRRPASQHHSGGGHADGHHPDVPVGHEQTRRSATAGDPEGRDRVVWCDRRGHPLRARRTGDHQSTSS